MKKWYPYLLFIIISLAAFRLFSSMYYPAFTSDGAVPVLMIHFYKLPGDLYYWGIDRLGSLIPLVAQIPFRIFNISALTSESIVHYTILFIGFLAFSSFIKSNFFKICFALIWFFPPMRLVALTQFYLGIHYSLIAIIIFLLRIKLPENNRKSVWLHYLVYSLIIIISIAAVWVSDMAVISVTIIFSVEAVFYLRRTGLHLKKVLKEPLFYYFICGVVIGYIFINYAKHTASIKHNYSMLSDLPTIFETVRIFLNTILDIYLFKANEPFTSIYAYLLILILAFLFKYRKRIYLDALTKKVVIIFALDAILIFAAIMVSQWASNNLVSRRYFTCTYVALSFIIVLLFDNMSANTMEFKILKIFLISVVIIGGIGTIYNLKFVWPKRLSPMVQLTSEWQDLGDIGIIADYWNSYIISCTAPDQLTATPHDKVEVKNYDFVEEIFKKDKIYVNRDMWMESFPDTLHQFGRTLIKEGSPFFIGDSHACKYTLIE